MAKRYDFMGSIKMDAGKTPEGFLKARALITKCGVFPYERPDGTIIRELRSPDEVYKASALKSMEMMGIQVDHVAMLDLFNNKSLRVGTVCQDIQVDAPYVSASLVIDAKDGIDAIEKNGKNQLSCGYHCDLVMSPGIYQGEAYDAMQTNIAYNHLALCSQARLGSELAIHMDAADAILTDKPVTETASRNDSSLKSEKPMIKITINGIQYDAAPEVSREIERLVAAIDSAKASASTEKLADKASFDSEKKTLAEKADGFKAERDAAIAKSDSLKAEVDAIPAKITDGVKARIALEHVASKVLPAEEMAKLDGKSDLDIKKAVVIARMPKAKLDGESEGYIATAYRLAVESMDEQDSSDALSSSRGASAPRIDGTQQLDAVDSAQKRYQERLLNGGKLLTVAK